MVVEEMSIIISTALSTITGLVIGFLVGKLKKYHKNSIDEKKNNEVQNEALKLLLQSNLTNAYFVYDETKKVRDYQYKNWINMFKIYKELHGNDYIDEIKIRMEKFDIIKTDILK